MSSATSKPQIENRIREHVITLAGTIGERNVFRLQALGAAGDYIEAIFEDQGYRVNRQEYEACDVVCANLEATLPGASRPEQILLLGAHYDSVAAVPAPTTTAAVWHLCWRSCGCSPARRPCFRPLPRLRQRGAAVFPDLAPR